MCKRVGSYHKDKEGQCNGWPEATVKMEIQSQKVRVPPPNDIRALAPTEAFSFLAQTLETRFESLNCPI